MTSFGVKVELSKAATEAIAGIPQVLSGSIVPRALRAGGKVITDAAARKAPRGDPSHNPQAKPLAETIGYVVRKYDRATLLVVGTMYPAGAHGHLVERGTKRHAITAKAKHGMTVATPMGIVGFGRTIEHPGAKPSPFLQPAVDETKDQCEAVMIATIDEGIQKAMKA
jgi:HK97 gp10 family phage protein